MRSRSCRSTSRRRRPRSSATRQESPITPAFYTRHGNPNHNQVSAVIAELEGAERAFVAASVMGAFTAAVLTLLKSGDHVVAQRRHYVGVASQLDKLLPRFGIERTGG